MSPVFSVSLGGGVWKGSFLSFFFLFSWSLTLLRFHFHFPIFHFPFPLPFSFFPFPFPFLTVSTAAASLCILTSLIGFAGLVLNNRAFLAVYTFMLWACLALIVTPGYITYKQHTFNLEGKVNSQWSRTLGVGGRLRIQNQVRWDNVAVREECEGADFGHIGFTEHSWHTFFVFFLSMSSFLPSFHFSPILPLYFL